MFKSIAALTISFFSQFSCAQMMDHSSHMMDVPTVHGMAMVGTKKIYLSHLPMFHTPHDYQALFEVTLSAEGKAQYLQSKVGSSESLYTLVPEVFALPEMVAHPKPFKASLYEGHFERGGQEIASNVTVTITKVLYFYKFSPTDKKTEAARYLVFGNSDEQFAAHLIVAKPDFDQLASVTVSEDLKKKLQKESVLGMTFANKKNQEPLQAPEVLNSDIQVKESLYLEFGDLSN